MDEWTRSKNRSAAARLNRAFSTGEITPLQVAAACEVSPRAAYRRAENDVPMRVFEPALIYDATGNLELAADLVGFTKRGVVCVAPLSGLPEVDELIRGALELGKHVGALQGAIDEGSAPTSPGGRHFVSEESARVLELLSSVQRVAAGLEQKMLALSEIVVSAEAKG